MKTKQTQQIGDIWHRVYGLHDEGSKCVALVWQQWKIVKVTRRGAWMQDVCRPLQKPRFALVPGARWVSDTKADALIGLIARKRRQIAIVEGQAEDARQTMQAAKAALAEMG